MLESLVVQQYIDLTYYSAVHINTDGSKDPDSGKTAAAVYIPLFKIKRSKKNFGSYFCICCRTDSNINSTSVDRRNTTNKGSDLHILSFSTKQFIKWKIISKTIHDTLSNAESI